MIILHIDDNADDCFLLACAFRNAAPSARIIAVPSVVEATRYLEGREAYANRLASPLPDLILLDLHFSEKSAFEFIKWWTESTFSEIPLVVFSGTIWPAEKSEALKLGAFMTVEKPCSLDQLTLIAGELCRLELRSRHSTGDSKQSLAGSTLRSAEMRDATSTRVSSQTS